MTAVGRPRGRAARPERWLLDLPLSLLVGATALGSAALGVVVGADGGPTAGRHGWPMGPGPGPGPTRSGGFGGDRVGTAVSAPLFAAVLVLVVAVGIRRWSPRVAHVAAVVGGIGYLLAGGPLGPVMLAPALTLLAMARALPPRRWVGWIAALVPFVWAGFVTEPALGLSDPGLWSALVFGIGVMVLPALIGLVLRNRQEARARTRELELRRSVADERLRIAREVHDVVGHSLSVISMQAGVALHLLDRRPEQVEESLQAIRATSKNALDELRATLAVFRGQAPGEHEGNLGDPTHREAGTRDGAAAGPAADPLDERAGRHPAAGLGRLEELVDGFRAGGRRVELIGLDQTPGLPAAVDLAGYRIVQESLTNVARHTETAAARVIIDRVRDPRGAERLVIEVTDDGPPTRLPPSHDGTGLAGMAERARALGGRLTAVPRPDGGFRVHADLPITPGAAVPFAGPDPAAEVDAPAPVGLSRRTAR